jgi:NADH pyrophosphatase NudC (nudix superfamily)
MSCGGHVSSGETYEEAFRKEMSEELSINIDKTPYKILGKCSPEKDRTSAFMTVYELELDESPDYNQSDFQSYEWLSPKEVIDKIESGVRAKGDLGKLVKKFYLD